MEGYEEIVILLLNKENIIFDLEILSSCCILNQINILKILLEYESIDFNYSNSKRGYTPLMVSCEVQNISCVELLINSKKVNLNKKCHKGNTAFNISCQKGNKEIIGLFLELRNNRLNYNLQNKKGESPFISYCLNSNEINIYEPILEKFMNNEKILLYITDKNNNSVFNYLKESMKISSEILIRLEMKIMFQKNLLKFNKSFDKKFKQLEIRNHYMFKIINFLILIVILLFSYHNLF